jgi:hypothetical protein
MFLSTSTPKVREMIRAIRGQPQGGLRVFELDDSLNKCRVRPFRSAFLGARPSMRTDSGPCDGPTAGETRRASMGGERRQPFGCVLD